ncbi:hypothetical protein ACEWY4_016832 [Coilia grayii]|uniref:Uncharacterized protein n=1 Tax=Coilia grayii TaxID=363190 RepID=A0ABD1JLR5_9TELE
MRYLQAAQVTEDSRLLYLLIKMLQHHPPCSHYSSPSKLASSIKSQCEYIADRVKDDPVLCSLSIPLPNINNNSVTNFFRREEKANYRATVRPKAKPHQTVLSEQLLPIAPALPLDIEEPQPEPRPGPSKHPIQLRPAAAASYVPPAVSAAPVFLVVPAQPQAPSIQFSGPSSSRVCVPVLPPSAPTVKPILPKKSDKPCGGCQLPQCGRAAEEIHTFKRQSGWKMFTFCPSTNRSTTSGFKGVMYDSYEHFKSVVDKELEKTKKN